MKLLFDENLSPAVVRRLQGLFPGSAHVHECGLGHTDDADIWKYARANGYAIVSKDSDHHEMSILNGCPPKLIWIRTGNCTTSQIEQELINEHPALLAFDADESGAVYVIQ